MVFALLVLAIYLFIAASGVLAEDRVLDLGCFKDNTTRRVVGHNFRDGNLSTKQCIEECRSRGFVYAALEVGIECFCGNDQVALLEKAPETDCNFYCAGERSKRCGGNWRFNVFSIKDCEKVASSDHSFYLGCFKDQTAEKLVGYKFKNTEDLTPEKCINECQSRGFLYAGLKSGEDCYCGNQQNILEERSLDSDCNTPCPGDKSKNCGGSLMITLYSVGNCEQGASDHMYLGCYKDFCKRKLSEDAYFDHKLMTPSKCVSVCKSNGFKYAGLQVGFECWCGNEATALEDMAPENECNVPCTGDNSKKCGGKWRNTIYSTSSSNDSYLGCFKDECIRTLNGAFTKITEMTPYKCVSICKSKGFFYAGIQIGVECWCGNERTALEGKVLEEECNIKCTGDMSKRCGDTWRNTIYAVSNVEKGAYRGCYKDESNRKLKGQYFIIDYPLDGMTPAKCLHLCGQSRFMYAGLQVGVECYCGNRQLTEMDKAPESECNFGCTGDYAKKCGGNWRNTIYSTGYTAQDVKSPLKESQYLGCFKDGKERRFKEFLHKSETMVPEKCVKLCYKLGYLYAALQAGSECYCGDTQPILADKAKEADCQYLCFGDYSRKCGGLWRNSVYSTEIGVTKISPVVDTKYTYLGCYKATPIKMHDLQQDFGYSFTPKVCVEYCQRNGLPYASLHAGSTCKCFSKIPGNKDLLNDNQCVTKCTGDKTKICGGLEMDSVYESGISNIALANYNEQYVGCYNEDFQDLKKSFYFENKKMSVGLCITFCKHYGYLYAFVSNGNQCKCGDKMYEDTEKIVDEFCSLSCPGDAQNQCGGMEKESVYKTGNTGSEPILKDIGVEHLGCFREEVKNSELRAYIVDYEDQLKPKKCIEICTRLGFKYTGLLSGSQCLCGNTEPIRGFILPNNECNTRCTGEVESICGGYQRVTVYKTTIQSVYGEIDIRSRYLGCYRDQGDPRSLRGSFIQMDKLTPWKCVKECKHKNYLYAGLQVGSQCYCGDQHPQQRHRLPDSSCNFQCFGDSYRLCGGNWANTIYHTSSIGSEARILDIGYRYLGCYKDQENPRQLSSYYSNFDGNLTPLKCVELCKKRGYYYAGLQYGDKCYCGDKHPIPLDLVDEKECDSKCNGDVKALCGGNRRNLVYFTGNNDIASIDTERLQYLGCYKDEESQRHLQGYSKNEISTPNECVTLCESRGYIYAGLQNSSDCYCGDQYPSPSDKVPSTQCNSRCTGDTSKICGGILRNTIYATGYSDSRVASVANVGSQYIGCHTKQIPIQLNGKSKNFNNTLTPGKCVDFCKENGHLYCALHYSTWCYCGDSSPPQSDKVPEGECSSKCLGDVSKVCGGPSAFTVYITSETHANMNSPTLQNEKRCITSQTIVNGGQTCSGSVVFEENFSKPISRKKWNHIVQFADEPDFAFVVYNSDRANSYTSNGKLIIKPSILPYDLVRRGELNLTECTSKTDSTLCSKHAKTFLVLPPVQSARLSTRNSFSFRFGKVEIIAKLPVGDWIFPEIWLEPKGQIYGPHFISGRVNLAMSRGNQDLVLDNDDLSCHHLECGVMVGVGEVVKENLISKDLAKCWHDNFHNFTFIWTPENMIFYIDGEETQPLLPKDYISLTNYLKFSKDVSSLWRSGSKIAPFDTEFYLHLGLSVGGIRSFPDNVLSHGRSKPWTNKELRSVFNFWRAQKDWEPTWIGGSALEIDYIKVSSL